MSLRTSLLGTDKEEVTYTREVITISSDDEDDETSIEDDSSEHESLPTDALPTKPTRNTGPLTEDEKQKYRE